MNNNLDSQSSVFIDKSEFLNFLNRHVDTIDCMYCLQMPLGFGKTTIANMVACYYSDRQDSLNYFSNLKIGQTPSFKDYQNKYQVIHLELKKIYKDYRYKESATIAEFKEALKQELLNAIPDNQKEKLKVNEDLNDFIYSIGQNTDCQFVFVIDDYDYLLYKFPYDHHLHDVYLGILSYLFKSSFAQICVSFALLTGIQPLKRFSDQCTLNNFYEISIFRTYQQDCIFGFSKEETLDYIENSNVDFEFIRAQAGKYLVKEKERFNPAFIKNELFKDSRNHDFEFNDSFLKNKESTSIIEQLLDKKNYKLPFEMPSVSFNTLYNGYSTKALLTYLVYTGILTYDEISRLVYPTNESSILHLKTFLV
ncbi:MAG: AAA family ATPase [Succinatimonas sp.]|nr:AAA family ATPase [Succinatimonas sp.]MDY5721343.1 AAA family ATPase [Succinivibrio sp.]